MIHIEPLKNQVDYDNNISIIRIEFYAVQMYMYEALETIIR